MSTKRLIKPVYPGTILLEEFLELIEISQYHLAKDINVPARRINEIIEGKRAITVDTALRLALYLIFHLLSGWDYKMIMNFMLLNLN